MAALALRYSKQNFPIEKRDWGNPFSLTLPLVLFSQIFLGGNASSPNGSNDTDLKSV
jgi:hypothetical protein